jgi:hypothetical protein
VPESSDCRVVDVAWESLSIREYKQGAFVVYIFFSNPICKRYIS